MRVLCIDDDLVSSVNNYVMPNPVVGEIYTVIKDRRTRGVLFYQLAEFPDTDYMEYWFDADAFVPLSNVDETDMKRNFNVEKVRI